MKFLIENELEKRHKKHKKTIKPGAMGSFIHPDGGNQVAIDTFNNSVDMGNFSSSSSCCGLAEDLDINDIEKKLDNYISSNNISVEKLFGRLNYNDPRYMHVFGCLKDLGYKPKQTASYPRGYFVPAMTITLENKEVPDDLINILDSIPGVVARHVGFHRGANNFKLKFELEDVAYRDFSNDLFDNEFLTESSDSESLHQAEKKLKRLISVQHFISPKDDIQLFTTEKGNYLVKRNGKSMMILGKENFRESEIEDLRLNGYFDDYAKLRMSGDLDESIETYINKEDKVTKSKFLKEFRNYPIGTYIRLCAKGNINDISQYTYGKVKTKDNEWAAYSSFYGIQDTTCDDQHIIDLIDRKNIKNIGVKLPTQPQAINEELKDDINTFIEDSRGYGDYNQLIDDVADEFNLSKKEAENYVWEYFYNEGHSVENSYNESYEDASYYTDIEILAQKQGRADRVQEKELKSKKDFIDTFDFNIYDDTTVDSEEKEAIYNLYKAAYDKERKFKDGRFFPQLKETFEDEYESIDLGYISGTHWGADVNEEKGIEIIKQYHPYDDAEYCWAKSIDGGYTFSIFRAGKKIETFKADPDQEWNDIISEMDYLDKDVKPKMLYDSLNTKADSSLKESANENSDTLAALKNFKKHAEIGDQLTIDINGNKGEVSKEADGWYLYYGGLVTQGSYKVIEATIKDILNRNSEKDIFLSEDYSKEEKRSDFIKALKLCAAYDPNTLYIDDYSQKQAAEAKNREINTAFDKIMMKYNVKSTGVPAECTNLKSESDYINKLKQYIGKNKKVMKESFDPYSIEYWNYDPDEIEVGIEYCENNFIDPTSLTPTDFENIVILANGYYPHNKGWKYTDVQILSALDYILEKGMMLSSLTPENFEEVIKKANALGECVKMTNKEIKEALNQSSSYNSNKKKFYYDEAVDYLESKGVDCDPSNVYGEYACDLLDDYASYDKDDEQVYYRKDLNYIIKEVNQAKASHRYDSLDEDVPGGQYYWPGSEEEWESEEDIYGDEEIPFDDSLEKSCHMKESRMTNKEIKESLNKLDMWAIDNDATFYDLKTLYEAFINPKSPIDQKKKDKIQKALNDPTMNRDTEKLQDYIAGILVRQDEALEETLEDEEDYFSKLQESAKKIIVPKPYNKYFEVYTDTSEDDEYKYGDKIDGYDCHFLAYLIPKDEDGEIYPILTDDPDYPVCELVGGRLIPVDL